MWRYPDIIMSLRIGFVVVVISNLMTRLTLDNDFGLCVYGISMQHNCFNEFKFSLTNRCKY